MINEVRLMGFFGADPEIRETNGGEYKYARFPLSLYRRSTNRDVRGNFIQCEAWNRTGEIVMEMGKKGSRAIVEGELRVDLWKNEQGETRSRTYVRVSRIIFVDQKVNNNSNGSPQNNTFSQKTFTKAEEPTESVSAKDDEFDNLFDEFDF